MMRSQSWIIVLGLTVALVLNFLHKTYRWLQFRRGELKQVWANTTANVTATNRVKDGIEVKMWYEAEGRRFDVEGLLEKRDTLPTSIPLVYKIGKPEEWDYAEDRPINADEFADTKAIWLWIMILIFTGLAVYFYLVQTEGSFQWFYR